MEKIDREKVSDRTSRPPSPHHSLSDMPTALKVLLEIREKPQVEPPSVMFYSTRILSASL
jgi:hypothetical protein